MEPDDTDVTAATDVGTALHSLSTRLLVHAAAIRGAAADRGDGPETTEGRLASELAGGLEEIRRRLDLVSGHLCERCLLAEVVERVSIEPAEEGVAAKPPRRGRCRKAK